MHIDQIERMLGSGGVIAVTPGDTEYDPPLRAIRTASGGDIAILTPINEEPVIVPDLLPGETFVASIVKVVATGTEATGLTGFR